MPKKAPENDQPKKPIPRIICLQELLAKEYQFMANVDERIATSMGKLPMQFSMFIWGESGNGKSNLVMQLARMLALNMDVLYVALEEGHEFSMQELARRTVDFEAYYRRIKFTQPITYEQLWRVLKRQRSPKAVIIDSLQYLNITYRQYQALKEAFPRKVFLFISHAEGSNPKGGTAKAVRYDVGIKVRVEGYVAFVKSRYGGNRPYIIWEGNKHEGAMAYWGRQFKKIAAGTVKNQTKYDDDKPNSTRPAGSARNAAAGQ